LRDLDLPDGKPFTVVMGSTPDSYAPGLGPSAPTGYAPIGALASTQAPPTSGLNSIQNSIAVKRAWGEYVTPVGQLRFGRMPSHWGLGILENSGDGFQTAVDPTDRHIVYSEAPGGVLSTHGFALVPDPVAIVPSSELGSP